MNHMSREEHRIFLRNGAHAETCKSRSNKIKKKQQKTTGPTEKYWYKNIMLWCSTNSFFFWGGGEALPSLSLDITLITKTEYY